MSMTITCWGTRGSVPISGPQCARYGGATTCVEVILGGAQGETPQRVIFDCGTGLAALGRARGAALDRAALFQTHMHWDHVQGFPFFGPLFNPLAAFTLRGVSREGVTLREVLDAQMQAPTCPVTLAMLRASLRFEALAPCGVMRLGALQVSWCEVWHPGGGTAYRLDYEGASMVFTGDVEARAARSADALASLAQGAQLLIMDAQYTEAEYASRVGWGHSTARDAVEVATRAQVQRLLLTHHDPHHGDDQLDAKQAQAQAWAGGRLRVESARDGQEVWLASATAGAAVGRAGLAASGAIDHA